MTTIAHTATKDQTGAPLTITDIPAAELDSFIRARAYELYEQGGREAGRAEEHWRQAQSEILRISVPGQFRMSHDDNEQWLTVMRAVQYFVRDRLEKAIAELPHYLSEHELARGGEMYKLAQPEIRRAVELLVPGLIVDFLTENSELVSRDRMPSRR
jgi:Protein of unknown function (DUF2934)